MKTNIKFQKQALIICIILFFLISSASIYSVSNYVSQNNILLKQIIWYLIGFMLLSIKKIKIKKIINYSYIFYIIGNLLLLLLLFFGKEINGSKCWFIIPGIGSFQPSEFMKIILIIFNSKLLYDFEKKHPNRTLKDDLKIFTIILLTTLLPSILTFLEPDTGIVIIYFLISFFMLFIFGIRKSIFLVLLILVLIIVSVFLYFYFNYQNEFINVFGTSFFYRIDRLMDWSNKSGMQLTNAIAAIKAAGIFGFGIGNTPIYIPEPHTDFIFSVYSSNTGLIGTLFLIIIILIFDSCIILLANNSKDKIHKYIITGFIIMILYQQIQNIGMNIGLLPITGITLPFISYGGSSLLSYMIGLFLILNYNNFEQKNKSLG